MFPTNQFKNGYVYTLLECLTRSGTADMMAEVRESTIVFLKTTKRELEYQKYRHGENMVK